MLDHAWFQSLWTLQEMVLRPNAWILFEDGLLEIDQVQDRVCEVRFRAEMMRDLGRTQSITENNAGKWCFSDFKFEIFLLDALVNGQHENRWATIRGIETTLNKWGQLDDRYPFPCAVEIHQRGSNTPMIEATGNGRFARFLRPHRVLCSPTPQCQSYAGQDLWNRPDI